MSKVASHNVSIRTGTETPGIASRFRVLTSASWGPVPTRGFHRGAATDRLPGKNIRRTNPQWQLLTTIFPSDIVWSLQSRVWSLESDVCSMHSGGSCLGAGRGLEYRLQGGLAWERESLRSEVLSRDLQSAGGSGVSSLGSKAHAWKKRI